MVVITNAGGETVMRLVLSRRAIGRGSWRHHILKAWRESNLVFADEH
jgi:hypothetical protein